MQDRDKDGSTPEEVESPANTELEIVSTSIGQQDNAENDELVQNTDCSSCVKYLAWEPVDFDPPEG